MCIIVSVEEAIREEAHRRLEAAAERHRRAVRPIYGQHPRRPELPESIGSCTLVRTGGTALLLTASHVLEHHKVTTLHVAGEASLMPVTAEFHATVPTNDIGEDPYDFAACVLTAEQVKALGEVAFIEEGEIPKGTDFGKGAIYGCLGFPLSKNKDVNATDHTVKTTLWKYASYAKRDGTSATKPDAIPSCHLFVQFDRKHAKDRQGIQVNAINPAGASGGPVLYLGNLGSGASYAPGSPVQPKLAGILTKNPKNGDAVRATRIDFILRILRDRGLIPAP